MCTRSELISVPAVKTSWNIFLYINRQKNRRFLLIREIATSLKKLDSNETNDETEIDLLNWKGVGSV